MAEKSLKSLKILKTIRANGKLAFPKPRLRERSEPLKRSPEDLARFDV